MKYKWNKDLYKTTGIGKDNKFDVGLISSKFNEFKRAFKDENQKRNAIYDQSWRTII